MTADPERSPSCSKIPRPTGGRAAPDHEALDELVETAHAQREDDAAANQAFHETHTGHSRRAWPAPLSWVQRACHPRRSPGFRRGGE